MKPNKREYVLYDSIYKTSKCKLFYDPIWSVVAVDGWRDRGGRNYKVASGNFWVMKVFIILIVVVVSRMYICQNLSNFTHSVQFSHSVVSDSFRPHGLQHASPPRPSPTPGVYSNSCPSSWWCHPAISSSVVPFSSCPQSLPASGSFPMNQLFAWGGQSILHIKYV